MDGREEITRFRGERRIAEMMKFSLDILGEIYLLQGRQTAKLGESMIEMEEFLKAKYDIDVDLGHLVKHAELLDEETLKLLRKRLFTHGETLRREL